MLTSLSMHLSNQILATKEQIQALVHEYPKGQPVVMVNLLKFKGEEGRKTYERYSKNMIPLLQKAQARVIYSGNVNLTVIGDSEDQPDMVILVEYPSTQHFIEMATSPEYKVIGQDREISLIYGGLLASSSIRQFD